jgi:hypothetical protein
MKNDYTHIVVILDRTGSMDSIRDDTIGGFNAFLSQQKAEPSFATLTLVQFDSQDSYEIVHRFKALDEVPDLTRETFVPRASTPLLDAIGRGINDLESSLANLAEDNRPSRVVMVIITDGAENASREFNKDQIQKMITEKQSVWQFVFLSADMTAINDALEGGMRPDSTMSFDKNARGTKSAWFSTSAEIAKYRSGQKKDVSFSEEDRAQQDSEQQGK